MFTSDKILKHFNSTLDFKKLRDKNFLYIHELPYMRCMPFMDEDGELVVPFIRQYIDIIRDGGSEFESRWPELCDRVNELKIEVGLNKRGVKKVLERPAISEKGCVLNYDTLVNLYFRLQLLLLDDRELKKRNYELRVDSNSILMYQGQATRAKFYLSPHYHSLPVFGIQQPIKKNNLTKMFFAYPIYGN